MILIDTSAWVEFLRNTGSSACERVNLALEDDFIICDAIRMEVLAGARTEQNLDSLRRLLAMATLIPTDSTHYGLAAMLFRHCRSQGATVRKLIDCLIAAVAIRADIPILHYDRDFDVLARHTKLKISK